MAQKEEKVALLRKVDIFSQLLEYELDVIAKYSEFIKLKKGQAIFSQGSSANELYVVESGRVGIISFENDDARIAQITANESFGEFDFLGRIERSAAAFAEEDSQLLKFPAIKYTPDELFHEHPVIFARLLYRLLGIVSERIWSVNNMLYDKTHWLQDLRKQLLCDKMTGLYNQIFLKEDFVNLLPSIGKNAALLMIKPDNFKDINDGFGHEAGDQVLNLLAIFLQSELQENDIGVRFRGDEYAAILIDTDRGHAVAKAEDLRTTFYNIDLTGITGEAGITIKVSIGIAMYPDDTENSADLVTIAHEKMMTARGKGGDIIIS
ncbi:MAG TPA: GGDEF domain-containing protein [Spirochaetota bacterium]|nr:GGDEF domain-containing protein [Spirochaetota bacterium]